MKVKTGDLRNNLSRYIRRIRKSGETLILCDRDKPVAKIVPIEEDWSASSETAWEKEKARLLAKAKKLGIHLQVPEKAPRPFRELAAKPPVAPDGRTDINTVEEMRKERDY